jgi:hypothetical protein
MWCTRALLVACLALSSPAWARRFSLAPVDAQEIYRQVRSAAHIHPDGTVTFGSPRRSRFHRGIWAIGAEGNYRAEKERFLAETFELRAMIAARFRQDAAHRSLAWLPAHLERIWQNRFATVEERRETLFAIWDEAAESDDGELGWAGAQARRIIDEFVRWRLPEGSKDAYGLRELERLNARRGRGPAFDPYRPLPPPERATAPAPALVYDPPTPEDWPELKDRLARTWDADRPAAQRRALLFVLWDGAGEPGERRLIERFIRNQLPPRSPDSFTDEELARYAGLRGDSNFRPYQ